MSKIKSIINKGSKNNVYINPSYVTEILIQENINFNTLFESINTHLKPINIVDQNILECMIELSRVAISLEKNLSKHYHYNDNDTVGLIKANQEISQLVIKIQDIRDDKTIKFFETAATALKDVVNYVSSNSIRGSENNIDRNVNAYYSRYLSSIKEIKNNNGEIFDLSSAHASDHWRLSETINRELSNRRQIVSGSLISF